MTGPSVNAYHSCGCAPRLVTLGASVSATARIFSSAARCASSSAIRSRTVAAS